MQTIDFLLRRLFVSFCAVVLPVVAVPSHAAEGQETVAEGFQFEMRDLAVAHQGGNSLNLKVSYQYKLRLKADEYPDFTLLNRASEEFFAGYPNQTDFWEILNLKLTGALLEKFPALASITIEIRVAPTPRIPFPRASTVTRTRGQDAER